MRDVLGWLEDMKLGEYLGAFTDNKIDFESIIELNNEDLREIGIPLGPRKRMLAAIEKLKNADFPSSEESKSQRERAATDGAELEAERRQLTVMFCDLVGSTQLSQQLDPEDLRDVMRSYQDTVTEAVTRYGGHVAKYLGDGVLVYFGWPQAYEDQAKRAVLAGLRAVDAVGDLKSLDDLALAARVGIATGTVVVGDLVGKTGRDAEAVTGETPNLAARLQACAEPGQVVVGELTHRLLGDAFHMQDLGGHDLKGFKKQMGIWRVDGEVQYASQVEGESDLHNGRLIGRQSEVQLLLDRWDMAQDREGQTVLVSGEPGIGKSRLIQALRENVGGEDHICLRYQCSPYHTNSSLYPVIQHLVHAAGFSSDDTDDQRLDKLEDVLNTGGDQGIETLRLFADLLSLSYENRYGILDMVPKQRKEGVLGVLTDQLLFIAEQQPVLFLFEDAHWIDPTTQELLESAASKIGDKAVFMVITHRPNTNDILKTKSNVTLLSLNRLGRQKSAEIARSILGKEISDEGVKRIVARADGVPLYIEELTKSLEESGQDIGSGDIPETLQASLLARLDRLGPDAKEIAQVGSIVGREFDNELLSRILNHSEDKLAAFVSRLIEAELIYPSGDPENRKYIFKHALVQEAAYSSMLRERRASLHQAVVTFLQSEYPDTRPEVLARHYSIAGNYEQAEEYWRKAGEQALAQAAYVEAIEHFREVLRLIEKMPVGAKRVKDELATLKMLGPALMIVGGWVSEEVRDVHERARVLAREVESTVDIVPSLVGLWLYYTGGAEHEMATEVSKELSQVAQKEGNSELIMQSHHAAWPTQMIMGNFEEAKQHICKGISIYDEEKHCNHALTYMGHDPGVCAHALASVINWVLGFADQARQGAHSSIELARRLDYPPTLAHGLTFVAEWRSLCGEYEKVGEIAEELRTLGIVHNMQMPRLVGERYIGWTQSMTGSPRDGIKRQEKAVSDWQASGIGVFVPLQQALLAESYLVAGQFEKALVMTDKALVLAQETREWMNVPHIHLIRARIFEAISGENDPNIDISLTRAFELAGQQKARMWQLKAANIISRKLHQRGESDAAANLLAPLYAWFTEGFDTAELVEAKKLLDKLS